MVRKAAPNGDGDTLYPAAEYTPADRMCKIYIDATLSMIDSLSYAMPPDGFALDPGNCGVLDVDWTQVRGNVSDTGTCYVKQNGSGTNGGYADMGSGYCLPVQAGDPTGFGDAVYPPGFITAAAKSLAACQASCDAVVGCVAVSYGTNPCNLATATRMGHEGQDADGTKAQLCSDDGGAGPRTGLCELKFETLDSALRSCIPPKGYFLNTHHQCIDTTVRLTSRMRSTGGFGGVGDVDGQKGVRLCSRKANDGRPQIHAGSAGEEQRTAQHGVPSLNNAYIAYINTSNAADPNAPAWCGIDGGVKRPPRHVVPNAPLLCAMRGRVDHVCSNPSTPSRRSGGQAHVVKRTP